MIDHLLTDVFGVLSCPFWCTVLQCDARLPIHTLNYWTSGARFLTGDVFECDIVHRRCLLNHALNGPYVPVRVTRGALVAHRYTYAPPCRTSQ